MYPNLKCQHYTEYSKKQNFYDESIIYLKNEFSLLLEASSNCTKLFIVIKISTKITANWHGYQIMI